MGKRTQSRTKAARIDSTGTVEEPAGIVISNGNQDADVPRFSAYVWGPVPEADAGAELVAVA